MPEGSLVSYPIRVPNWAAIKTWKFEEARPIGDPTEAIADPIAIIVYVGPAAPFPALPPVQFHANDCHLYGCDSGCLYG